MQEKPQVYLAGPDVFRTDSGAHGARLVEICARHGLVGLYPADDEVLGNIAAMRDRPRHEVAEMVFRSDVAKIHLCHGVIANLEPFRSPSADPGTTWEMGMAYGQGKPVFAYCADRRTLQAKTLDWNGAPGRLQDGLILARDGMAIDALDEIDNLMMTRSVIGPEIHPDFETAVIAAARHFRGG